MDKASFFTVNKSARFTIILLLFIPLIIAVIFGLVTDPESVTENTIKQIAVSSDNSTAVFEFGDASAIKLYSSISENAKQIDESYRDFSQEKPYYVTFTENNDVPLTYTFYMSTNESDCVYVSPTGKYFMMAPEIAKQLIVREEFSSLNNMKTLPAATLSGFSKDISVNPDSYEWTYTTLDGNLATIKGNKAAQNPLVKFDDTDEGVLKFNFDKAPDSLKLTITANDDVVFDDKYENLSGANKITYTSDTKLKLKAIAEWYNLDNAEYFGKAEYSVDLLYDVAPTYKIVDAGGVTAGDFTILRISDFNDNETLSIKNDLGIPETANVYDLNEENSYGPVKFVFIPLGADTKQGEYTLTLTTDSGHTKDVKVKAKNTRQNNSQTLIIDDEALTKAFTKEGLEEFDNLVTTLTQSSVNERLFEKHFSYPTGSSKQVSGGASYGTHRKVMSLYSSEYTYGGVSLEASAGQNIVASNNGKVVFAGENSIYGKLVIVDHGCSVLSYYGNLSEISVKAGDSVTIGETSVGKAGNTGFSCILDGAKTKPATQTFFAVSFGGVFIDPQSPCKYGINF